ncbi:ABC transporter substrate-binding protein [Auraticoccus monumenti]|uniref:Peptide/nickel transport system substrate-binding protein n=1 Tax=Auraticoccus monumenti TaxID=675864 RepID=A0A1G7CWL9_9ACTN|nr:ABC transporter substrate-binding protein [Auraticoccus monumenti]SDE43180.1 peptide/nickel transport system substrate-binding protein [Auraticoccus monumenti]
MELPRLTRRSLLYGSAVVAGTAALAACTSGSNSPDPNQSGNAPSGGGSAAVGSATEPLPAPGTYQQAPNIDPSLPPVAERLPENPYVIPHNWATPGKYGGKLNLNTFSTTGTARADSNRNFFYGHSPLRYLNDGKDIAPGLVESWESNEDASEWTFYFRKGLKWSDGEPFTTENVMFWWDEFVIEQKMAVTPPDEARSGTGALAEFTAVDDTTLRMTFDAPAPLTADRMAMWVNGNIGKNGPIWVMPSHYLKQFHPDYGDDVPDDWDTVGGLMETKADWHRNPDCPTLIGYRCKSFDNTRGVVLERNPYYWAVMPNGDQLPYIDEIQISVVSDAEAGKLQVQQGSVDYTHGPFNQITLNDVQGIRDSAAQAGTEVVLWDSGSGTGSIFFLNYDYVDEELRDVIREPKFRQAISHAFNREAVRRSVYFNTGEATTGTLSPKAIEYQVDDTGRQAYSSWRDAYVAYDVEKAKQLLEEIGVTDADGDGMRELPGGGKLTLRLDTTADSSQEHKTKDNQLVSDLKAVGIEMRVNPIPPQSYDDEWKTGKLMGHSNWEVGDGPNHLVYPQWLVPLEFTRWAPLEGQWYQQLGTKTEGTEADVDPWERTPPRMEPEPDGPIQKLWDLYNASKVEPDELKRHQLVWDMIKIHISDGPFFIGSVANYPQVIVVKTDLKNVPRTENLAQGGMVNPWIHPTPAVYDPECYFWDNPDQHTT